MRKCQRFAVNQQRRQVRTLFGYVRPYKPFMRVYEYEVYRSVYCGVCKSIAREFGELPRFTLSYDLAFLALMDISVHGIRFEAEQQRCIAHPLVKRNCAVCTEGLEYAAYASIILLFHKLNDDKSDGRGVKKLVSSAGIPFITSAYIKARKKYPSLAAKVEKQMRAQAELEKERCPSIDRACEPTARIMQAVFFELGEDAVQKKRLGSFGYFLGRFIYLTDALDDLRGDALKGRYNPLLCRSGLDKISDEDFKRIADSTVFSVNMSLGLLADAYCKCNIVNYRPILDNIIYLGLKNVFKQVREETFHKRNKERIEFK